uniref:FAM69 protein-kinase domain-containing protein n=2 Tax=Stomoxys calcitrans TaxID=35570 RepID=A0A1I8PY91_STOCA
MVSSSPMTYQNKRELSHRRLILLLVITLNTLDVKLNQHDNHKLNKFQQDLSYCGKCFEQQIESCGNLFKDIKNDEDVAIWWQFLKLLPQRSCKRNNNFLQISSSGQKIVEKYFANSQDHLKWSVNIRDLKEKFLHQDRLDGLQFYPPHKIENFIDVLHEWHMKWPKVTIWLYLLVNIQPILMPLLYAMNFPVPQTYGTCGFTLYQEHAGLALHNFYIKDFDIKLKIAQELLKASLKFSHGFQGYRLYITDLTADNIVYDVKEARLSFVDLDTVFVVDSLEVKYKSSTHKHEYIECPGCFAYSPEDISAHNISDINIYSTCQFLREDLYRDQSKGFLQPIPQEISVTYPQLGKLLNLCVDCPWEANCSQRFGVAKQLLLVFEDILNKS